MSYDYKAISKKDIRTFVGKFRIIIYKPYSYRIASGINGEKIFIITDDYDNRCSFTTEEFEIYFYTEQEYRLEKLKRLNKHE